MAKEWAKPFYASTAWKKCRLSYINSVNGLCERCLSKYNKITPGYICHHKILLTPININNPEVTLNHEHLEYVCKPCHDDEHGIGSVGDCVRDGLKFNIYGDLVVDSNEE